MKKKWFIMIGGAVILVVFVVLALTTSQVKKTKVTVEKARRGEVISVVTATGKVKAQSDVKISADVMGRIEELPVEEGDRVKKGQLLVKIDSRSREMDVAQAQGNLMSAKSNLETARLALEREKQLFAKKLSSQAQLDVAQNNYDRAKAEVQIAQASLDRALDQLQKCTIRSPMDGIVTQLNSEVGENVVVGTMNAPGTVIMVISDLSAVEVEAEVDETDIAMVQVGQDVDITLDAFPDTTFKGKVTQVGNSARTSRVGASDEITNFLVKVLITDKVPNIKPGMTASVDITTAVHSDVIKVPSGAVVMRPEGTGQESDNEGSSEESADSSAQGEQEKGYAEKEKKQIDGVFVVRGSKATFVPVKTGIRDQQYVEIVSGLSAGDSVITGPYRTLRIIKHGEEVQPKPPRFAFEGKTPKS